MATHPKCVAFKQDWTGMLTYGIGCFANSLVHFQDVIAVYSYGFHTVTNSLVGQTFAAVLLVDRGGETIAVIFNDEQDGQLPYGCYIECFMELSFTRTSIGMTIIILR